jgi:hypothetical protein
MYCGRSGVPLQGAEQWAVTGDFPSDQMITLVCGRDTFLTLNGGRSGRPSAVLLTGAFAWLRFDAKAQLNATTAIGAAKLAVT